MSEIPKTYEPATVESKWYEYWMGQRLFVADPHSKKPAYSIVIPPPNVTGILHMGHVLNNTIQDILARKARMDRLHRSSLLLQLLQYSTREPAIGVRNLGAHGALQQRYLNGVAPRL